MHLKRIAAPKSWPIKRKGTKYVAIPSGSVEDSLPLIIVTRDILNLTRTKKETKKILQEAHILVNGRVVRDEKYPLRLFDILTLKPSNVHYRIVLGKKGKFKVEQESKGVDEKISKITNKRVLKGKKVQINLSDGRNYLSDMACKPGDSVVISFGKNKIERVIPFEENKEAMIIVGKNSGEKGKILKIDKEKNKIKFRLDDQDKEIEIRKESLMVLK